MNHTEKQGRKRNNKTKKMKRMNCHPRVKLQKVVRNSCMTKEVLEELKKSYNENHKEDPIVSLEPKYIWKELRKKLSECPKEDCWLETIKDEKVRKELKKTIFAPNHPNEWKEKPSTWLTNHDILKVLKQYEETYNNFKFIGPTPIDFDSKPKEYNNECVWKDLCAFNLEKYIKKEKTKIGVVFNLDKHNEPGSHWTSLFIDLEENIIFYLDSAGDKIPDEVYKLVVRVIEQGLELPEPKHIKYYENHPFVHQRGNNECGMYALYFIITMITKNKKLKTIQEKIDYFKSKRISDTFIFKHRKQYFNSG